MLPWLRQMLPLHSTVVPGSNLDPLVTLPTRIRHASRCHMHRHPRWPRVATAFTVAHSYVRAMAEQNDRQCA
jgi:hypothetical protein